MIVNDTKVLQKLEIYLINEHNKLGNQIVQGLSFKQYNKHVASMAILQQIMNEIEAIKKDLAEER